MTQFTPSEDDTSSERHSTLSHNPFAGLTESAGEESNQEGGGTPPPETPDTTGDTITTAREAGGKVLQFPGGEATARGQGAAPRGLPAAPPKFEIKTFKEFEEAATRALEMLESVRGSDALVHFISECVRTGLVEMTEDGQVQAITNKRRGSLSRRLSDAINAKKSESEGKEGSESQEAEFEAAITAALEELEQIQDRKTLKAFQEKHHKQLVWFDGKRRKCVPIKGNQRKKALSQTLATAINEKWETLKGPKTTRAAKGPDRSSSTPPAPAAPPKAVETGPEATVDDLVKLIEGMTTHRAVYDLRDDLAARGFIVMDEKRKMSPAPGVEGSNRLVQAIIDALRRLNEDRRILEAIQEDIAETQMPFQIKALAKKAADPKRGYVEFEETGDGPNDWKVTAVAGSTIGAKIAPAIMERKSHLEATVTQATRASLGDILKTHGGKK